ncbi:type IIL restriction-modification enzyme MmeI [Luteimonas sp. A537]
MPLSLNEIRDRARAFAREWDGETSERAEAQSFWNDFFHVFGKKRRSVAVYEQKAKRFTGTAQGRIDLFWPGVMLAEHKSAGVDLDAAFDQATDYFAGLELEIGVSRMERRDPRQGAVLRTWLDETLVPEFEGRVLPVDGQVALRCARLHVPDPQPERDALLAATALAHGLTVVTRNEADFAPTGVDVFNPWRAWAVQEGTGRYVAGDDREWTSP